MVPALAHVHTRAHAHIHAHTHVHAHAYAYAHTRTHASNSRKLISQAFFFTNSRKLSSLLSAAKKKLQKVSEFFQVYSYIT